MYNNKKIMGLIPARGGSKGIPHKNIIDLCGKPLISYSITAALESKYIDCVMVSTDDEEIAAVAKRWGAEVPFLRPAELASDTARTVDAVVHAVRTLHAEGMQFDTVVLLQPTQPLRTAGDIDAAIETYMRAGCEALASVSPVDDHPLLIRSVQEERLMPLLNASSTCRRQDMPDYYRVNGCIYINEAERIDLNTSFNDNRLPYVMEKSHSVDIDELNDLVMAAYYLNQAQ